MPSDKPRLRDLLAYLWTRLRTRTRVHLGATAPGDAQRLVELGRAAGDAPPEGCAWLDETTVADLELPLVLARLDRTVTPTGAQVAWRWLVAPAQSLDVLARRERGLAWMAADPVRRAALQELLARGSRDDTAIVPHLLWGEPARLPVGAWVFRALRYGFLAALLLAGHWHWVSIIALVLLAANLLVDDRVNTGVARQARALEMLGLVLANARSVVQRRLGPPELCAALAEVLPPLAPLGRRIATLTFRDPFELADLVRAALLVRVVALAEAVDELTRERAHLRRLVDLVGELDALAAIATLRTEHDDLQLPELHEAQGRAGARLEATDLRHPAIEDAVGNPLVLRDASLVLTGSNMSGKSTFLRAVALNAVLAQAWHTTWGGWRAPLLRVVAAMRVSDDTALGTSTYAAEVQSVHRLVDAAGDDAARAPALLVLDEPFRGTNPAARVPIVVAVLEHLAQGGIVGAATHDLEVAARLSPRFQRGFFRERSLGDDGDDGESFDYRLRPGSAPSTNALALLRRAGYPAELIAAAEAGLPGA